MILVRVPFLAILALALLWASRPAPSSVVPQASPAAPPGPAGVDPADVAAALALLRDRGAYMINSGCRAEPSRNWPGYEALPDGMLQRCTYAVVSCAAPRLSVGQRDRCRARRTVAGPKRASVVLLEPGLERFAIWMASACATAGGDRARCLQRLFTSANEASGWQIPVAGIVFEDFDFNHFVHFGYAFRDGMTVRSDPACGWVNGNPGGEAEPNAAQDAACSRPDGVPPGVSNKVRPVSGTRSELVAWRPEFAREAPDHAETYPVTGPAGEAWRRYVREVLVTAATRDSNPFVTARAVALRRAERSDRRPLPDE